MKKELITNFDPKSPVSEVFRTLRTNIQFMNSSKKLKTLLVTSTLPSEGKSWVSANLAVAFAQAGKRVVLVDADMRKGRQFSMFEVRPVPGLSNYLANIDEEGRNIDCEIEYFIQETDIPNLYVIPSGNVPSNPSELLISERMTNLVKRLEDICDIVIFDGTPSLLVTDAIIIARMVDSTIIVTAHKETKMDNLLKVKKNLENVGANIAGVVFNKIPLTEKEYKSKYYYYGTIQSLPKQGTPVKKTENSESIKKYEERIKKDTEQISDEEIIKKMDMYIEENKRGKRYK